MAEDRFFKLFQRLYQRALDLRRESERRIFLSIFAGLGTLVSVGMGGLTRYFLPVQFSFLYGMLCSSACLLPVFIYLGMRIWDRMQKARALSGDPFDYLKYVKDEYEQDIKEIRELQIAESQKRQLVGERYESYRREKAQMRDAIRQGHPIRRYLPPHDRQR